MDEKMINYLIRKIFPRGHRRALIIIFFGIAISGAVAMYFGYYDAKNNLTEQALARREAIVRLAALAFEDRFDRLIDTGVALATRVRFRQLVEEKKWEEAVDIMKEVPADFPFIERVFLSDVQGTLQADTPALPDVRGKSFAFRDWYKGVSINWQPYISEIYKRSAEPQYNVIAAAIPIRNESRQVIGILVLQIRLDALLAWNKEIDVGKNGVLYFVDKNGALAAHPEVSSLGEIVRRDSSPIVQKILGGEEGIEIGYDAFEDEELITAYRSIPRYGWGVIVHQPTSAAFAIRDAQLRILLIWSLVGYILICALSFILLRIIDILRGYWQKEKIFLESIGDGLLAIDREWNITLFNRAASMLTGWTQEEVAGKPLRNYVKFIRERDRAENIEFIEHAMVKGETGFMENNTLLIRKNGEEIPVGDSASPLFGPTGKVIGAIIIFRDVSKEKMVHRIASDFAYASHQLRTPVTKALWSLEAVLKEKDVNLLQKNAAIAYQSMRSMEKLSEELIITSEIDQGTVIPKIEKVKLIDILDSVLRDEKEKSEARRVAIKVSPVSAIAAVYTDQKLFSRILVEVLNNAIMYSPENGVVEIEVSADNGNMVFEIRDNGIGIPEKQQTLVFTKFFRATNVNTTEIPGLGLGLFIAREYANLLRGKIWFKSAEKAGTTFSILLPQK